MPPLLASGASTLAAAQALAKLASFGLNTHAARSLSPSALSVPLLHFALAQSAVQAPRDGCRRALLRLHSPPSVRLALVPLALALPVALAVALLARSLPLSIVCFSSALELLAEPLAVAFRRSCSLRPCAFAEASTSLSRAVSLQLFLRSPVIAPSSAMAYAFSEACASAATVFAYSVASLVCIPSQSESKARVGFTTESYRTCAAFVAQDFLKLALSESEKLVVVSRSPDREQGGFGLASNLGSLFARIALKPIEDSASSTFSSSAHDLHSKASLLQSTMHILFSASLLLAIVAQPFVQIGLHILYGPVWAAEPSALRGLRAYCAYIPFLAFNGVIEAYADALLSVRAITERNISLVLATALQVALQLLLEPHFGVIGIICGNCAHMLARCVCTYTLLRREELLHGFSLRRAAPPAALLLATAAITSTSSTALFILREAPLWSRTALGMLAASAYFLCALSFSDSHFLWLKGRKNGKSE